MHQMDVSSAFLHFHLEEQVFCQQPTGFVDSTHPEHVACSRARYTGSSRHPALGTSASPRFSISLASGPLALMRRCLCTATAPPPRTSSSTWMTSSSRPAPRTFFESSLIDFVPSSL